MDTFSSLPSVGRSRESVHRSEEHTSELQSLAYLVCRLLLEKKKELKTLKALALGLLGDHAECSRSLVDSSHLVATIFFFFNDTSTTEIYTLSLHDALPISRRG